MTDADDIPPNAFFGPSSFRSRSCFPLAGSVVTTWHSWLPPPPPNIAIPPPLPKFVSQ